METLDRELWAQIIAWLVQHGGLATLAYARGFGLFMLLPLFLANPFPPQMRTAIPAAVLPIMLVALSAKGMPAQIDGTGMLMLSIAAELAIGALISIPVGALFWAAQSAGELIDIQTGANNNAVFNTGVGSPEGPAQTLMVQLAMLAFLAADGLHAMVAALWSSYALVPVGAYDAFAFERLPGFLTGAVAQLMVAILQIAGPLVTMFLLLELGIGLAGRMAQQLHVSTIAAPAKGLLFPLLLLMLVPASWFLVRPMAEALGLMKAAIGVFVAP